VDGYPNDSNTNPRTWNKEFVGPFPSPFIKFYSILVIWYSQISNRRGHDQSTSSLGVPIISIKWKTSLGRPVTWCPRRQVNLLTRHSTPTVLKVRATAVPRPIIHLDGCRSARNWTMRTSKAPVVYVSEVHDYCSCSMKRGAKRWRPRVTGVTSAVTPKNPKFSAGVYDSLRR
jgi:hypothetical protein